MQIHTLSVFLLNFLRHDAWWFTQHVPKLPVALSLDLPPPSLSRKLLTPECRLERSDTKRGTGIAILNTVGQCGPLLGTRVFPVAEGPFYVKGMSVCAGFMFFNALLAFGLRTYFKYMNDKWDRQAISFRGRMDGKAAAVDPLSSTEKVGVLSNETQEKGEAGDPQKAARSEGAVGWDNSSEWRFAL